MGRYRSAIAAAAAAVALAAAIWLVVSVRGPMPWSEPAPERESMPPANPRPGATWTGPVDGRRMVWIAPGSFQMGSPAAEADRDDDEDQHAIAIDRGFWLDSTEVTNEAYMRFLRASPEWRKDGIDPNLHDGDYLKDWEEGLIPEGQGDHPVAWVSWHAAQAYALWAGKRLPTEAEWEYACRAGTRTAFWWGDNLVPYLEGRGCANAADASAKKENPNWTVIPGYDDGYAGTSPAAVFQPNALGLFDMAGNVWEWVSSSYLPYPYRSGDGREDPKAEGSRVFRGGSWLSYPRYLRSANRDRHHPRLCLSTLGFRCARSAAPM